MMQSLYGNLCHEQLTAALIDQSNMSSSKDTTFTKIFVGGLPYHTTDKTLREYFEQFGDIEEAVVITERQTGKSRGYGFVTMKDRTSADRACKDPNPIIDGRKANVNLAYLGAKPRNNLQFAGLPQALPLQTIPTMLPSRFGLPQLYYPASQLLTSPTGLMLPSAAAAAVSPLSPTAAASQYLNDYWSQVAAASNYAAAAANPSTAAALAAAASNQAAAYDPYAAYYGMLPGTAAPSAAALSAQSMAAYQALQQATALQQTGAERQ